MSQMKFRAEVRDGKLFPLSREYFDKQLKHFEGNVVVTVEKLQSKRSLNQNAYYWGVVLPTIAESTGHAVDELHEIFKRMFIKKQKVVYRQKEMLVAASTTRLKKGEFAEYLERIFAEAAGLGIVIPSPDEYFGKIHEINKEKVREYKEQNNIPNYEEDPNYQPNVQF